MRKIVAVVSLTLDGVMQAPGRKDEDTRGGFEHGGWAGPYFDPVMMKTMGEGMAGGGPMLFGRRTYEDFYRVWPARKDNPFSKVLDEGTEVRRLEDARRSRCRGRIRRSSRARPRRAWLASRSSPARTSWCWAAETCCRP